MRKIVLAASLIAFASSAAIAADKCCCDKAKMKAHHATMMHKK